MYTSSIACLVFTATLKNPFSFVTTFSFILFFPSSGLKNLETGGHSVPRAVSYP